MTISDKHSRSVKPQKGASSKGRTNRDRILDAAEELFSRHGYDAVSIRDITDKAKVKLALASYYFRSKEILFEQVIMRRFLALDEMRRSMLAELLEQGDYTIEDLLYAFVYPYYEKVRGGGPGWRNYGTLVAQTAQTDRWLDLLARTFDPTAVMFFKALQAICPGAPYRKLMRAFFFTIQLMLSMFGQQRRIEALSGARVAAGDLPASFDIALAFAAGGIRAVISDKSLRDARRRIKARQNRVSASAPITNRCALG